MNPVDAPPPSSPPAPAQRLVRALRRSVRELLGRGGAPAPAEPGAVATPPSGPRVLVVDGGSSRTALAAALSARGFQVANAGDAAGAVRCMSEEVLGFDLLVLGPAAAREDGDLLIRTLRRGGEADLAVVVVTIAGEPAAELERAGADAVLDGSLGAELIARASEAVLSRKRQRQAMARRG